MSERQKQIGAGVVVALALAFGVYGFVSRDPAIDNAWQYRTLMDSETGELVKVRVTTDMPQFPHKNRKTGKDTLYPFEICYFGECGKTGGTRVILEPWLGRPGPTHCPKCGHRVVDHNPRPASDALVSENTEEQSSR